MTAMKKKRNAFTLVELLVVIAILAILATVSVIGYTAFVNRANESNALSEMTQARDLIRAELMDGEVHTYGTVDLNDPATPDNPDDDEDITLQLTATALVAENVTDLKAVLTDLAELPGTFTIEDGGATVVYTTDTAMATWTIAKDTITTNS